MSEALMIEIRQAILRADLDAVKSLLEQDGAIGSLQGNGASLLSAVETRALNGGNRSAGPSIQSGQLEEIYLVILDSLGAGETSPYQNAWWSDRLMNVLLDKGYDTDVVFSGAEGAFGLVSLCARACAGETMERLLRQWLDCGDDGPLSLYAPVVACTYLNPEALRYLLAFFLLIPDEMSLEELTREAVTIVAEDPDRTEDFRLLVKHLVGAGVSLQAEADRPSALVTAFEKKSYAALDVLLDAGCDPKRIEPTLGMSIEDAIALAGDNRMCALLQAWHARDEMAKSRPPVKTFESVLHDPLTVHLRGRSLN